MKSKNKTITFGGFAVFFAMVLFLAQAPKVSAWFWDSKDAKKSEAAVPETIFGVTKSIRGEVVVDLTPVEYDKGELAIKIGVNTHSVDNLHTYDLTKIVFLNAGTTQVNPVSAPKINGHHGSGKLIFKVETLPKEFSVSIKGLDSELNREFIWP